MSIFRSVLLLAAAVAVAVPLELAAAESSPKTARSGVNALYADLERALDEYSARWGRLPDVKIPSGPGLQPGQEGPRVALLRQRLGLPSGIRFDGALAEAVRAFRKAHGLTDQPLADVPTIAALNRGPAYYERLIHINMDRARALPARDAKRYILVDAAAARLWLYVDGKAVDSMKVIVGAAASQTPMLTTSIGWAEINPYWNVPPNLVQRTVAPGVLSEGTAFLARKGYEVMSDWTNNADVVDPVNVDWHAVAAGRETIRVRQRPGADNAMGEIKFVTSNDLGIFLHDTPNKALFAKDDRWLSNGCVRVEDARRLARWLLGDIPTASARNKDLMVPLAEPVPVHITYLTAAPAADGQVVFRSDPYGRDTPALARVAGATPRPASLARSK